MLLCVTCSKPVKILVFKGLISQYNRFPQPTKGGQQIKLSINSIDNFDIYIYIYKVLPSLFYDASNSLQKLFLSDGSDENSVQQKVKSKKFFNAIKLFFLDEIDTNCG